MSTYNYRIPNCCVCRQDGAGAYEVAHTETSQGCRHRPSGGTGGHPDGHTACNRIISHGHTRAEACAEARRYFTECSDAEIDDSADTEL
jgi:hypothetical protein